MGKCLLFRRALCLIIRQHYIVMWPESLALFVPLCPVWQHQSWGDSEHRSSAGRKDRAERAAQAETNSRNWPAGSAQHGTVHRLHKLSTWQITQHSPVSTLTWQTCAPFKGLSNVFARNVQCLSLCMHVNWVYSLFLCTQVFLNHGKTGAVFRWRFVNIFMQRNNSWKSKGFTHLLILYYYFPHFSIILDIYK